MTRNPRHPLPEPSGTEKTIRLFVALVPDDTVRAQLDPYLARMVEEYRGENIRWIHRENIHLTLRFIGNTPASHLGKLVDALTESVSDTGPFEMTLSNVLYLPRASRTRVVAVGVKPCPDLEILAKRIEKAVRSCGFEPEEKRFLAHFTLGRSKHIDLSGLKTSSIFDGFTVPVTCVCLVKSTLSPVGSLYETLNRVTLTPNHE
jgi:2'-5' RNA ligase